MKITETSIYLQQTDTNKILFILYDYPNSTPQNIASKVLSFCPTSPTSPFSPIKKNDKDNKDLKDNKDRRTTTYMRDFLNKYITRLLNKSYILRDESEKPYKYSLTEIGKEFVLDIYEKWNENIEIATKKEKNAHVLAERIDLFEEYLKQDYIINNLIQSKGKFEIDVKDLASFNHTLAERLLDDFDNTDKCLKHGYERIEKDKKIIFLYSNLPETEKRKITELRLKDLNKLISVVCELEDKGVSEFTIKSIKYECPSCGNIFNVLQNERKLIEPSGCGCGRRGKFKRLEEEKTDSLQIVVRDMYENLNQDQNMELMRGITKDEPERFDILTHGDKLALTCVLRDIPKFVKNGSQSIEKEKILEVKNIKKLNKFYTDFTITEDDTKEIEEISKDPITWFRESFFNDLYGIELQSKAATISAFSDLHILFLGSPGRGKSTIMKRFSKLKLKGSFIDVVKATPSGIIGTISTNMITGKYTLDSGALKPLHPGGLIGLDELDKDNEYLLQKHLMSVISDREINVHKANTRSRTPCDIVVWGACNLKNTNSGFDTYRTEAENFNIISPLWDRFELKVYYNNYVNWNSRDMLKRLFKKVSKEWEPDSRKFELAKKYQQKARQVKVKFEDDDYENLSKLGEEFVRKIEPNASFRVLTTMMKLLEGVCKLHLRTKPLKKDFQLMTDLITNLDIERRLFIEEK